MLHVPFQILRVAIVEIGHCEIGRVIRQALDVLKAGRTRGICAQLKQ